MRKRKLWKNPLMVLMCSILVFSAPVTYAASDDDKLNVQSEAERGIAPIQKDVNIYRKYKSAENKSSKIIKRSVSKSIVSRISNQNYSGKSIKFKFTLRVSGKSLKQNKDFTVSFRNNKNIGTAQFTVKGKGNYTGSKTFKFKIVPKKPSIINGSSPKTGQLKISWNKDKQASRYVVTYAQDKAFKKGKGIVQVKNGNTTSKTISKLEKGEKYYVKIQTYKTVKGVKYLSGYSSVKMVNIKKEIIENHGHIWKEGGYKVKSRLTDVWLSGYSCYPCGVVFNIDMDDATASVKYLNGTTKKEKERICKRIKAHEFKESIFDHCGTYCPQDDDIFHLCAHLYNIDLVTQLKVNYRVPSEYVCSCGKRKKITVDNCKHSVILVNQDGVDRYTEEQRKQFASPNPKYLKGIYSGTEYSERTIRTECLSCGKKTTPSYKQRIAALKNYNKRQGTNYKKEHLRSIREKW